MGERQNIERQLDDLVSRIVRRRDLKNGCITCGRPMIYETSTAGHFMHRSHRCTRWSIVNVNAQCWSCNRTDDTAVYEQAMIRKYGQQTTERIKNLARTNCHYSVSDLREIYRELKEIEKQTDEVWLR